MVDPIRATEKDWENVLSGARVGSYMARCILELRDRVAALEDAAAHPAPAAVSAVWVGTAADVAPQVVPVGTPVYMAPPPAPATADGLSPVEPAPQAQQGVTVEELACIMREMPDTGYKGEAAWLLDHPRLGPLLRGEGAPAPKRVVLPEEPPAPVSNPKWFFAGDFRYVQGRRDGWKAAYAEVERQQGGQADG